MWYFVFNPKLHKKTKLPVTEREDNLSSNQFDSNIFYRIPFNLYKDKNESNNRASYVTKIVNCMLQIYFRKGEQNPIPINLYIYTFQKTKEINMKLLIFSTHIYTIRSKFFWKYMKNSKQLKSIEQKNKTLEMYNLPKIRKAQWHQKSQAS
jgi:hypothetical protein